MDKHGAPSRPEDIGDGHQCIRLIDDVTGRPHVWHFVNRAGEIRKIIPDCSLTVNDAPSLMAGLDSDFGIIRALDFMVEDPIKSGRVVEILPDWNCRKWPAYLYTPACSHLSAGLEAFISFVLSHPFGPARSHIVADLPPRERNLRPSRRLKLPGRDCISRQRWQGRRIGIA